MLKITHHNQWHFRIIMCSYRKKYNGHFTARQKRSSTWMYNRFRCKGFHCEGTSLGLPAVTRLLGKGVLRISLRLSSFNFFNELRASFDFVSNTCARSLS